MACSVNFDEEYVEKLGEGLWISTLPFFKKYMHLSSFGKVLYKKSK